MHWCHATNAPDLVKLMKLLMLILLWRMKAVEGPPSVHKVAFVSLCFQGFAS